MPCCAGAAALHLQHETSPQEICCKPIGEMLHPHRRNVANYNMKHPHRRKVAHHTPFHFCDYSNCLLPSSEDLFCYCLTFHLLGLLYLLHLLCIFSKVNANGNSETLQISQVTDF